MSGIGVHQYDKLYALQTLLPPTFLATKLSLLLLYLSIFHPDPTLRASIHAGIALNTLFYSVCLGAQTVAWTPRSGAPWFATSFAAASRTPITLGIAQSAFNLLSDLYLLLLPLCGVAQLQLSPRKKLGVAAIFLTGALACPCSALTLAYRVRLLGDDDSTWHLAVVFALSIVETTVGIMCACMPALAAFVRLHAPLVRSVSGLFGASFRRTVEGRGSAAEGTGRSVGGRRESERELRVEGKTGVVVVTELAVEVQVEGFEGGGEGGVGGHGVRGWSKRVLGPGGEARGC
ncbi:hypothetical protein MMC17_006935 [Xylographa soralifera]|nr:hypothetical protein [Xylographa soralifera]